MILLNNTKVETKTFPNGETLITTKDLQLKKHNYIRMKFEEDKDFITLLYIMNHIQENGYTAELFIPYMPYSRMDRTEGQNVFTLKYIAKFINDLNFTKVIICEPHSDVCTALLNKVRVMNMTSELVSDYLSVLNNKGVDLNSTYLVYPDAGASKRYGKQIEYDKVLTCIKDRDFKTGFIKSLNIDGEIPNEPFNAIIVDDLSSRGGTFILTASKLKEIGAKNITLIVTHAENTILEGDIFTGNLIDKVITTNSIIDTTNEKVHQLIATGQLEITHVI